ncbi:MAG: hypothetical protein PWP23_729 [Candidatus Sumerlaeota bacterium]|nr:hypothetical protein [Candidatus Sumerlaeota bacterium]
MTRFLLAPVLMVALALALACEKGPEDKPVTLDPQFSVNVMAVPTFWPREDMDWPEEPHERVVQENVYREYGRPDYFRNVHTFDRRIVLPIELEEGHVLAGRRPKALTQWIYIDEGKVLTFDGGKFEESELTDEVRTVCTYGDPQDIKRFDRPEFEQVSYLYYDQGLEIVFIDGKKSREKRISAPVPGAGRMR